MDTVFFLCVIYYKFSFSAIVLYYEIIGFIYRLFCFDIYLFV